MKNKQNNLSTRIGGLELSTPLITASGTFGYAEELEELVDFKSFGALITKTITLEPLRGNDPPRLFETCCGLLNSIGLENPGMDEFLEEKWPYLSGLKLPVIVSIGGKTREEFIKLIRGLEKIKSLKAIEVNISCPNVKKNQSKKQKAKNIYMFSQDGAETFDLVEELRELTKKTLIIKLTPNVTDIANIALAAQDAGADAVSIVNTYFGMAVDIKSRRPVLANIIGGLSGPAIKPLSLYALYQVRKAVKIPIIAGGGIMNALDAIEFLICGANALSLGTVNFINPKAGEEILNGIQEYMSKNNIKNLKEFSESLTF